MLPPVPQGHFRHLLAARACSAVGDFLLPVAVTYAVLGPLGGNAADVGLVLGAEFVGILLFVALGGVVADRVSPAGAMVCSDLVSVAVHLSLAGLLVSGHLTVPLLAAGMLLQGVASSLFRPAARSLLPRLVPREQLLQANAMLGSVTSVAVVMGPLLGGVLVVLVHPAGAIATDAASFAVSAALIARIHRGRSRSVGAAVPSTSLVADLAAGWREVSSRSWLWASIAVAGVVELLGSGPLMTLTPVVAARSYGGAPAYSWMLSALGCGAVVGSLVMARVEVRRPVLVAHVALVPIAAMPLCLAVGAPLPVTLMACLAVGACEAASSALWGTALGLAVPRSALGRVSAWDTLGSFAVRPAGQMVGGALAGPLGFGPVLFVGAATFVVAPLALLLVPAVRQVLPEAETLPPVPTTTSALP
jgi:MFS family permease